MTAPRKAVSIAETLAENLLEGLQVIGFDYRYLFVNATVARHGKTTKQALIGRTMMEAYPGIENTEMFALLRRVLERRDPASLENEFRFPDGTAAWFELRMEPVPEGVAILSVDITDRKRAELELGRTMRALKTLSRTNHALVRADDEARFMDEVCRIMVDDAGYRSAWIGLVDWHDARRVRVAAQRAADEIGEFDLDPALDDDEATIPVRALRDRRPTLARARGGKADPDEGSMLALPLFDETKCVGVLTVCAHEQEAFDDREREVLDEVALDLGFGLATLHGRTERRAHMAALEQARARVRATHDASPTPVLRWKRLHDEFSLIHVNEAARDLFGPSALDTVRTTLPELVVDVDRCVEHGLPTSRELRVRIDGESDDRHLAVTCGYLPPDEVLTHIQDLTQQRNTEAQLRAAQRLEEIGRLAGGIAHDFNNLLSVISSYTAFALESIPEGSAAHADIVEAQHAAARGGSLTRQLLTFSRRQVVEPVVTNWRPIVAGLEKMMRRLLGEDIQMVVHAPDGLGNIRADPGQLEQIVINLLVNARDAMPAGGRLTVEMGDARLDEERAAAAGGLETGEYVMLSVSDTGIGMDAATRARVFDPFYTTKGPGKGTGLGLSTVRGIAEQHGGGIWLWSEPGRGTTFEIYLPRCDAAREERIAARRRPERGSEKILLVEDDATVRAAAARILTDGGYRVLTAGGVAEAEKMLGGGSIDLLLTDIVLPDGTGADVARRVRAACPGIKVLFMSGYSGEDIELEPDARFIAKPFSGADVRAKVREVLDSS